MIKKLSVNGLIYRMFNNYTDTLRISIFRKILSVHFLIMAIFLPVSLLLVSCGQRQVVKKEPISEPEAVIAPESPYDILAKKVPDVSNKYLGMKYRLGSNPDEPLSSSDCSSDCSNLICAITRNSLAASDYEFEPYFISSSKIYEYTFEIEREDVRAGDIMFFKDMKKKQNHLALVTAKKQDVIYFIQASSSSGVIERNTQSKGWLYYWKDRFDSFRRWKDSVFTNRKLTTDKRYQVSSSK